MENMKNVAIVDLKEYTNMIKEYHLMLSDYENITEIIINEIINSNKTLFKELIFCNKENLEYRQLVDIFINKGYKNLDNIDNIINRAHHIFILNSKEDDHEE